MGVLGGLILKPTSVPIETTLGITSSAGQNDVVSNTRAMQVTPTGNGVITKLNFYVVGSDYDVQLAVYSDNGGDPDVLLGETLVKIAPPRISNAWVSLDVLVDIPISSGVPVWLSFTVEAPGLVFKYNGSATLSKNSSNSLPGLQDPFIVSSSVARTMSIYANVTYS